MQDADLDLLRCFVTVAELRNFTAAGARLGRSQSAVSIRVKKLEAVIGAKLLSRNSQDVQLTESGRMLLPKALRLLDESERLLAEMRGPSVSGRLRIGLLEYIAPHRLPDIVSALQRKLPGADLQFQVGLSSNLKLALSKAEIDLALALHDPQSAASMIIARDQLVWVASGQFDGIEDGNALDVCLLQAPCVYRQAALDHLSKLHVKYREVVTSSSVHSIRSAVRSGLGVTVLGSSCLGEGLRVAPYLQDHKPLPAVSLSLHGDDHRKTEVAGTLRRVLADHLGVC